MSDQRIIGVDIGLVGALALLTEAGTLLEIEDMPVLADGPAGRRTVSPTLLAETLRRWNPARAYVELIGPRPKEGATGAFSFGRSRGCTEAVLAVLGIPFVTIAPAAWKRSIGIPPGREGTKDLARSIAIRRWPTHASQFARVRDDGRAEAALIAIAGLKREGRR